MFFRHVDLVLKTDFNDLKWHVKAWERMWEREKQRDLSEWDRVMVRQTERGRQIPWLHGCCGILGLVERSSSPGHVCFGRLCKGEICSSSLPALTLLQQQTIQWGATAALSHTISQQLLSPATVNSSSQSQLLSDYHHRAQQSKSLWFRDNDFICFSHQISPEIIISKLTTYRNINKISLVWSRALTHKWVIVVSLNQI